MWQTPALLRRAVEHRVSPEALAAAWKDPHSRVMTVDERGGLGWTGDALDVRPPAGAFDPQRCWLLGFRNDEAWFAQAVPGHDGRALRDVGLLLDDDTYAIACTAVALANWHAREGFCPRCGSPTTVGGGGFVRDCPGCGAQHFPRHDPAMIVAVLDPDDRLLLAHQHTWPEGRYSVLAGFCEAGESLEQCVHREVGEEVGVELDAVRYLASQPWPVPRSLMMAFVARAATTGLDPDGVELTAARWFSRAEYHVAVAAGELSRPASRSVAMWMIDRWLDGTLPDPAGE